MYQLSIIGQNLRKELCYFVEALFVYSEWFLLILKHTNGWSWSDLNHNCVGVDEMDRIEPLSDQ